MRCLMKTIFDSKFTVWFIRIISQSFFFILGWNIIGEQHVKGIRKCVIIAFPHESWTDLPMTIGLSAVLGLRPLWLGKQSLFQGKWGTFFMWLGGIPVARNSSNGTVSKLATFIREENQPVHLIISPEGTRNGGGAWKTGFYFIAHDSKTPLLLAFIDKEVKNAGILNHFIPSGDYKKDLTLIQNEYKQYGFL